ncbi:MAG TPA: DPP IV N-terminal domain-containing protein, partial [Verrucomicrobiae bacterium]|nr:DPP IV N-terminal domain-containing protein [Verrucomicrobiae bacterium]
MKTTSRHPAITAIILAALIGPMACEGEVSTNLQAWMKRISSGEFGAGRGGGGGRGSARGGTGEWVDGGRAYTRIERGALVRYDTASGDREVLMSEEQLTPPGLERALRPGEASADGKRILFATNPRTVMIRKTANDYWVLSKSDRSWHKLGKGGGDLLYAKLSPDGTRAAYVRDNNLFVESIPSGKVRQLTKDGSFTIINGTSDWVYEEEFSLRDAFEWSPDGQRIAYLQFDQSNVPEFALINYTDGLYPVITKYRYPKPGQTNSAVRAGIVSASGGRTRWIDVPGDPRNIYIPRIDWADANTVILQQMDRLQQTNNLWLADAKTGRARLMFQDRDDAWIDL